MAKAKALRYNARKERGEIPSKEAVANLDPYRWYVNDRLHIFFIWRGIVFDKISVVLEYEF